MVFDLQQIHTLDAASITELLSARKVILRSPFKEALVTRVYSYLTRVGTDDGYKNDLCTAILIAAGFQLPEMLEEKGTAVPSIPVDDPAKEI